MTAAIAENILKSELIVDLSPTKDAQMDKIEENGKQNTPKLEGKCHLLSVWDV